MTNPSETALDILAETRIQKKQDRHREKFIERQRSNLQDEALEKFMYKARILGQLAAYTFIGLITLVVASGVGYLAFIYPLTFGIAALSIAAIVMSSIVGYCICKAIGIFV